MKVLLIDDHKLFSKSLAIVLSDFPDIEEFSSTNDVDHIAEIVEKSQPDILLVDIRACLKNKYCTNQIKVRK